jgi:PAS domain S-box-containing protein
VNSESSSHISQLTDFVPRPSPAREPLPYALQAGRLLRSALTLLAAGCGICLLGLLSFHGRDAGALGSALAMALLALACLASLRTPDGWLPTLFSLWASTAVLVVAGSTVALGWGLTSPSLLLPPLLVLGAAATVGPRRGLGVAGVATVCLLLLAWQGGVASGPSGPHFGHVLLVHLAALALAWVAGQLLHNSQQRHQTIARQRESRYRGLLALAADAYWELDADYRIAAAVYHDDESTQLTPQGGLGSVPWRLPRFVCDPEVLDQLLAELDARAPFRDLPIGWQALDGRELRFLVSGEPRFGERGQFTGYWGVARDITADTAAREALLATETRYHELFTRIPTPLVLHRQGRVLDANPAALQLFDVPDLSSLRASDLLAHYEAGDSRERARRRLEDLEQMPPGAALPVTDFRLQVAQRTVWVRATGVRVAGEGGLSTLSIYIDDTERRSAEEAVRRSEAMLSHLVATSPDLITLTDLATGRYVMVNHAFERVTGHAAADAVGATSLELGVWRSEEERQKFIALMQLHGSVSDLPVRFVKRSGEEFSLLVSAARFAMDRRDYMVINGRDVTENERDRLEREAILANASVGIAVTSNRHFVLANLHFEALYGWGPGEIIGQPGSVVWASESDYAEVGRLVGEPLQRGEAVEIERQARRRDGSSFLARIRGRAVDPSRPADGGTVWIIEDITERHEFERALARARDEAEAASRAKSAFLANTSHELRTPLNGIVGLAHLARQPALDETRRQQYLEQISDSAQALADIISDILDLSKIEAGKLQLNIAAFDLGQLLQALQRTWVTLASARGLTLSVEAPAEVRGPVFGDTVRVRQILTNYLGNALKFTPSGSVTLRAQRLTVGGADEAGARPGDIVRLEVQDTGEGISAEVQARLFEPFTQADESTTRRFGGTGLGLSICRELALLMGGRVGLDSTPGQGSCFWAELPLPAAPAPAPPAASALLPAPVPAGAAAAGVLQGRRVLIVEDNPVNMLIAVAMMESWGVQVAQAHDGRQALQAVQQAFDRGQPFDAVLMDVQMPNMSGHEATRALRDTQAGCHLPIIALTAAALVSERSAALEAGMNDFLSKPVDAERLRATLARWLLPVVS